MTISTAPTSERVVADPTTMRAAVFHGPGDIRVDDVPRPHPGPGEAVVRVDVDDDLRHRRPHPEGRVPGPSRA